MIELFKFFGKGQAPSKDIAKERLKLVLVHDRANVSPKYLDMIKDDVIKAVSSYMEIEEDAIDIHLTRVCNKDDTYTSTLIANIPIKKMKNIGKNKG
ncbi:MAG: cell division topological specificity factor MinE [Xylanivirga thermophila]